MPREDPSHGEEKPVHDTAGQKFLSAGRSGVHTPDGPASIRRTVRHVQGSSYSTSDNSPAIEITNAGRSGIHAGRQRQREEGKERPHANAGRSGAHWTTRTEKGRKKTGEATLYARRATPDGPAFTTNV